MEVSFAKRMLNPCLLTMYSGSMWRPEYLIEQIEWIDNIMRGHIDEMKEVNDLITHNVPILRRNQWHNSYEERLQMFVKAFGLESIQTQSVMKMVVDMEWNSKEIRRRQSLIREFPAAYQSALIAHVNVEGDTPEETELRKRAFNFIMESWKWDGLTEEQKKRHPNLERMINLIRKYYRKYMRRLKPRIYLLTNGSGTRLRDGYNIYDINGIIYATEEEYEKLDNGWDKIISHFKMVNFDEDHEFISDGSRTYYGRINFAPDDSGKTRISYSIDPIVQVISKAVAECLDYVSRKIGNNCTKDQMRVLRNIIKLGLHKTGYIVSTDMSKYSDTLQIRYLLALLQIMGIPEEVCRQLEDLYTLPMYDSIRKKTTPRTTASYQGQYGDFSMITLANIWIQCCIFDFFGEYYDLSKSSCTSGAVGDDTIMSFYKEHKYLFQITQLMYNSVGVNINRTKTHMLFRGEGSADFIKRILNSDGLVPYVRLVCFHDPLPGRWIEEGLRVCRDNLCTTEPEIRNLLSLFLNTEQIEFICSLHKLNGGVIDRPITESDLKIFCYRDERLGHRYSNRRADDMRHWIDKMHDNGILLQHTSLFGFYEDWEEYYELDDSEWGEDFDEDVQSCVNYPSEDELEKIVIDRMLHCYSHGYKKPKLDYIARAIGLTYLDLKQKFPELYEYIEDYNLSEVYRYFESRQVVDLDIYEELISLDLDSLVVPDTIYRPSYIFDYSPRKAHDLSVGKHAKDILIRELVTKYGWRVEEEYVWYTDKSYLISPSGAEYRLYNLRRVMPSSRPLIPFDLFCACLGSRLKDKSHASESYSLFIHSLPGLSPDM